MRGRLAGPIGVLLLLVQALAAEQSAPETSGELLRELKAYPHRIVYEAWRESSFELFIMNADGSNPVNLTNTPDIDELYPHASPDGRRIVFTVDEGKGPQRSRNVCIMNVDGTGRTKIADGAEQACWNRDGTVIAFLKRRPGPWSIDQGANKGLFFYEVSTGKVGQHLNTAIERMLCIKLSPDATWFAASAIGGLGYGHSIIAFEAEGTRHWELERAGKALWQCRPDISPDGKHLAFAKAVGEFEAGVGPPDKVLGIEAADVQVDEKGVRTVNHRWVVTAFDPIEVYHADWSPDSRFIAFSIGPKTKSKMKPAAYVVGVRAEGWNLCVADTRAMNRYVQITVDGSSNKEPDWAPAPK